MILKKIMKIKKIKQKKIKEIKQERFKEVKNKEKNLELDEEREKNREEGFDDFSEIGEARRTAPVLQSSNETQNVNLETTAETAPRTGRADEERENADLYAARGNAEKGYGQEDYSRLKDYAIEARETARPALLVNQPERDMRQVFNKMMHQQTAWQDEDMRIQETWRNKDNIREIKEYENIEKKADETKKIAEDRRRRMAA